MNITKQMTAETKTIIDKYINRNYTKLFDIANNILKKHQKEDEATNLINTTYIYLIENQHKIHDKVQEGKIESIIINHMSKQVMWGNTTFWNELNPKGKLDYFENYEYEGETSQEDYDEMIEKEFDIQNKLDFLNVIKYTLPMDERILYEIGIVGPYNTSGKLSKHIKLNRNCSYFLLKNLKTKLKNKYDDFN